MNDRYVIPSLERAFRILDILAEEPKGISLADLARKTEIPKSTLFRILVTLQKCEVVSAPDDQRRFRLGTHLWTLGNRFADQNDLFRLAEHFMEELVEECEETVFLASLEEGEVVYLRRMESPKSIAVVKKLESRVPAPATATGLAQMAWLPSEEIDAILEKHPLEAYTDATVTDRGVLLERLAETRRREYAVVDGEYNQELLCVSAPVLNHHQRPSAALTVALLSSQVKDYEQVERVGAAVRRIARAFSKEMGAGREVEHVEVPA